MRVSIDSCIPNKEFKGKTTEFYDCIGILVVERGQNLVLFFGMSLNSVPKSSSATGLISKRRLPISSRIFELISLPNFCTRNIDFKNGLKRRNLQQYLLCPRYSNALFSKALGLNSANMVLIDNVFFS